MEAAQLDAVAQLAQGIAELGMDVPPACQQRLLTYLALLQKWNKIHNLTAIRTPDAMVAGHLLDSLSVFAHLPEGALLDVGSGGGLPGIPLAICAPERPVTLLDSGQKKTAFLRQAVAEVGLRNVAVVNERAERWRPGHTFDVITARALSEIGALLDWSGHLLSPCGVFAAMKGVYPAGEIARLPPGFRVRSVVPLHVPYLAAERHLVLIERAP